MSLWQRRSLMIVCLSVCLWNFFRHKFCCSKQSALKTISFQIKALKGNRQILLGTLALLFCCSHAQHVYLKRERQRKQYLHAVSKLYLASWLFAFEDTFSCCLWCYSGTPENLTAVTWAASLLPGGPITAGFRALVRLERVWVLRVFCASD